MPTDLLRLRSVTSWTGWGGYQVWSCGSNPNFVVLGKLQSLSELLWALFPQLNMRGMPMIFKVLNEYFILKNYFFLHILILYPHFFLVLTPFSHSKAKQYYAEKEQSCYNHWPGYSIFGLVNYNTWKEHRERQTLMLNFGNWRRKLIELFLLPETCFLRWSWVFVNHSHTLGSYLCLILISIFAFIQL